VLAYLNGVLSIVGGVIMLFTRDVMPGSSDPGTVTGITTSAIISIILGIVILVVARGLLNGSAVSRGLVAVVMIVNIFNGVLLMFTLQFISGIIDILWAFLMLALLFTRRANAFFASRQTS
jgi:hypothetical protein